MVRTAPSFVARIDVQRDESESQIRTPSNAEEEIYVCAHARLLAAGRRNALVTIKTYCSERLVERSIWAGEKKNGKHCAL